MNKFNDKLFSIITIVKNGDKTIQRCIDSVINQDYKKIEYIIVDGGSTDLTKDIIIKNNQFINKWISEIDSGTSDAVNKGLKMANGSYVLLLSCDDFLPKNFVTMAIEHFLTSDADVVFGDLIYMDQKNSLVFRQIGDKDFNLSINYRLPLLNTPSCVIKAKVYKEIGFLNEDCKYANDYELLFRIFLSGYKFSYCTSLYIYHYLGGSSSKYYLKSQFEVCKIAIKLGKSYFKAPLYMLWAILRRVIRNLLLILLHKQITDRILAIVRKNYQKK